MMGKRLFTSPRDILLFRLVQYLRLRDGTAHLTHKSPLLYLLECYTAYESISPKRPGLSAYLVTWEGSVWQAESLPVLFAMHISYSKIKIRGLINGDKTTLSNAFGTF